MASISKMMQTKDGRRYWRIQVHAEHDKAPYSTRFYWQDGYSQKSAERALKKYAAEFERQCKSGEFLNRKEKAEQEAAKQAELAKLKTVKQYATAVFMPSKEVSVTENTRANYQQFLDKHIFPQIGDVLLVDVTSAMITKLLLDYQKQGYAHASCVKLYNILNGIFEMAFLDDSIPMSPMLKVKRPSPKKDEQTTNTEKALTADELAYVLFCARNEPLKWQVYMELAADTGARRGELCGLQWSDIDFKQKTICISRNLQYTSDTGVYVATPKNGKTRIIDIGDDMVKMLLSLRSEQASSHLSKWVFSQDGSSEPMHPQSPTRYFKKFGDRFGIESFHPHMLRHTSASIAITNNADIASVSERLGHTDTAVTLRMYTHANQESIRSAGESVRSRVASAENKRMTAYVMAYHYMSNTMTAAV